MNGCRFELSEGKPAPLGARIEEGGINFALFSEHAEKVELCLFDSNGEVETARLALPARTEDVWHGFLAGGEEGLVYGYRVHGPYDPARGHRFNPNKLLIDPYAREIVSGIKHHPSLLGYRRGDPARDLSFDDQDSARCAPKGRAVCPLAPVDPESRPNTPWERSVIYELSVRGYTMAHPGIPEAHRGSFAGLANPAVIEHLQRLGVTAVELMPVHPHVDEARLIARGMTNYWGYNSYSFFAPAPRFLASGGRQEARDAIDALHRAGIEVILDVVYNHTGEGDELGPTLCYRGVDNASYYRLGHDPRFYINDSGCGNSLNVSHPYVRRMVLDSLVCWREDYGVDGFRFDLAASLGRDPHRFSPDAPLFAEIAAEPKLAGVKLIAEPWDAGSEGHWLGSFPIGWGEWNDRYRDTVRRFWRGDAGMTGDFATRFAGSSDIFRSKGRSAEASVNFVTAHDGFTLRDLVTYARKHNEANGEENRDGADHNHSWNCGMEGTPASPAVEALRSRQARNFLTTLLLSKGVPMLLAGDEFGRTQRGNNNAYCQDTGVSWVDWSPSHFDGVLAEFVAALIEIRRRTPALRSRRFFDGKPGGARDLKDVSWLRADGHEMTDVEWSDPALNLFGMLVNGESEGREAVAPDLLVLFNAGAKEAAFRLPDPGAAHSWATLIDTSKALANLDAADREEEGVVGLDAQAMLVLERRPL